MGAFPHDIAALPVRFDVAVGIRGVVLAAFTQADGGVGRVSAFDVRFLIVHLEPIAVHDPQDAVIAGGDNAAGTAGQNE